MESVGNEGRLGGVEGSGLVREEVCLFSSGGSTGFGGDGGAGAVT